MHFENTKELKQIWNLAASCLSEEEFIRYFVDKGSVGKKNIKFEIEKIILEHIISDQFGATITICQKEAADKILKLINKNLK